MKLSRVVVIVAVTAAAVYFGLSMMSPKGKGVAATETAATTDEVFAAETPAATEGSEAPTGETTSAEAPAASEETASSETPAAEVTETPATTETAASEPMEAPAETYESLPESIEAPAEAAVAAPVSKVQAMSEDDARRIAENISKDSGVTVDVSSVPTSSAAPAAGSTPSTGSDGTALSDEEARRIAENVAREVAGGGSAPAQAAEPAPVADAAPAPKPVVKPAAKPAEVADSTASAAPKPAKAAAKPAASKAAPTNKTGNGSDVITSWWTKPGTASPDRLALVYAGEASSEKAVVLLFNNAVDAAAAASHIKLVDARGAAPAGAWSAGGNPRVLAFKGVKPGRYTVILSKSLADSSGKTLGSEMVGPVYVH